MAFQYSLHSFGDNLNTGLNASVEFPSSSAINRLTTIIKASPAKVICAGILSSHVIKSSTSLITANIEGVVLLFELHQKNKLWNHYAF